MSCCSCDPIPTLVAASVTETGTTAAITVNGVLPAKGRFNLKFSGQCVPVCSTAATITITDGTTTYSTVLTRCGMSLTLAALASQIRRFCVAHFCGSTTSAGTAILQDKLVCNPTLYTPPAAAAAAAASASMLKAASTKA